MKIELDERSEEKVLYGARDLILVKGLKMKAPEELEEVLYMIIEIEEENGTVQFAILNMEDGTVSKRLMFGHFMHIVNFLKKHTTDYEIIKSDQAVLKVAR